MPLPKRPLADHEKDALSELAQRMGNPLDEFDMAVGNHLDRLVHEGNYRKMKSALTGGASETGLGQSEIATAQVKGRDAAAQQKAAQAAQAAQQAQGQAVPVNAPAAPSGDSGVSQPYPAQAGPQPPPKMPAPQPQASPGPEQAPPPEEAPEE